MELMIETLQKNAFPQRIPEKKRAAQIHEEANLLWRIFQRQKEVQDGQVKILKDTFVKNFNNSYLSFDSIREETLSDSILKLIQISGRCHLKEIRLFVAKITSDFRKEKLYKIDRRNQFSLDILFQIIELLSLNKTDEIAEQTIFKLGKRDSASISDADREGLLLHFRAYLAVNARIACQPNLKAALQNKDTIIGEVAPSHPEITLTAFDFMFRNIVAQQLLALKYSCETLIVEWGKEYNFEPECLHRMSRFIPAETSFMNFRAKYAQAIQSLKNSIFIQENAHSSDLFLLRSLANFYTSWIMKVSEMIPVM